MRLEGFNAPADRHGHDREFDDYRPEEYGREHSHHRPYNDNHGRGYRYDERYEGEHSPHQHESRSEPAAAFIHRMEDSLHKELNDVLRYCDMSKEAEEKGLYEIADGLSEIAKEEFTHAYFLKMHLKHLGEDSEELNPEIMKLWREVKHVMHIS